MQRRDTYRIPVPLSYATHCFIPITNEAGEICLPVVDISFGGLGLLGFNPDLDLQEGHIIKGCRIEVAATGIIHCDLHIGSQSELTLKNNIKTTRIGCKFVHLNSQDKNLLQRFIFSIEKYTQHKAE